MASKTSVVKAWEDKLGIHKEFRVEEVKNESTGESGFNLISRNGSVTAFATTLELLEEKAGEPFVEDSIDLSVAADPVEIDNSTPGEEPDEPTTEEAERLRTGVDEQAQHSGNDTAGETEPQGEDLQEAGDQSEGEDS